MSNKRICERALDFFQVYNEDGDVRLCSWTKDGHIGNLLENDVRDVYNSEAAQKLRERHIKDDYSECDIDACPYLAMNDIECHKVNIDENHIYPERLYIGFERVCNYACKCCTIHNTMKENSGRDLEKNYRVIKERLKKAMPYAKRISANGCGELFVSKHTLELLSGWNPIADASECSVSLETNGSLFDEKHFKQIENLAKYHLAVNISVMSFDEDIYRYISGTNLPISNIINNLKYVKSLREKGIINYLELATVVQEQNFRTMPEFVDRAVNEFGADCVRLRPYESWGAETADVAWFRDIRHKGHPLYEEYKRVMSNPIFKDPRVADWSGGLDTNWISEKSPYEIEKQIKEIIMQISLNWETILKWLLDIAEDNQIAIYGVGDVGKVLYEQFMKDGRIKPVLVEKTGGYTYQGQIVNKLSEAPDNLVYIITQMRHVTEIRSDIEKTSFATVCWIGDFKY